MIKPNKKTSTKEGINLISNIQSLTSNNYRGITLVSLIITIIVMLILVGVSVMLAIKGDLFGIAKRVAKGTEKAKQIEQELARGRIEINGTWYDSLEDYIQGKESENQPGPENEIKLTANKTDWTNQDITVTASFGENLNKNRELSCEGTEGIDYIKNGLTSITVKTDGKTVTAKAEDAEGNQIVRTITIRNIDRIKPTVEITPNGGTYIKPSQGNAKISATITAEDPAKTETSGQSGLGTIEYAWSKDSSTEPANWTKCNNGSKIEKADIEETGTWYLWTKVKDKAGNHAGNQVGEAQVTNAYIITSSEDAANQITLTPSISKEQWTNQDVTVEVSYGANLTQNRTLSCTGTEGEDYIKNGSTSITVKTNGQEITAVAEDEAGNKIEEKIKLDKIDKTKPEVDLEPNGGNYVIIGEEFVKISTTVTATDPEATNQSGQSELKTLQYAWSKNNNVEPTESEWVDFEVDFENETEISKENISEPGTWYLWTKVTDNAGNRNEEGKVSNEFNVKTEPIKAAAIKANPSKYYGEEVTGYNEGGVSSWRIYYADESNIYLIADSCIPASLAPKSVGGHSPNGSSDSNYAWFKDVLGDYSGSEWIINNSKAKAWLNKYLNSYPTSENDNVKAVAYLMDTDSWGKFASSQAEYAIGGPTLEMFCASYKDTHPGKYVECDSVIEEGYKTKWSDGPKYSDADISLGKNEESELKFANIYLGAEKQTRLWIASPAAWDMSALFSNWNEDLYSTGCTATHSIGLRPVICLSPDTTLSGMGNGVYSINN